MAYLCMAYLCRSVKDRLRAFDSVSRDDVRRMGLLLEAELEEVGHDEQMTDAHIRRLLVQCPGLMRLL